MAGLRGMGHARRMVTPTRSLCLALMLSLSLPAVVRAQDAPFDPRRPSALALLRVVRDIAVGGDIASTTTIERGLRIELALWLIARQSPETDRRYWLFYRPIEPFLGGPSTGFTYDKTSTPPPGPATDLHARLLLGNIDSYGCATNEDVSRILEPSFEERPNAKGADSREFVVAETARKVVWITVVLWSGCVRSISIVQTN